MLLIPVDRVEARTWWDQGRALGVTEERHTGAVYGPAVSHVELGVSFDALVELSRDPRHPSGPFFYRPACDLPVWAPARRGYVACCGPLEPNGSCPVAFHARGLLCSVLRDADLNDAARAGPNRGLSGGQRGRLGARVTRVTLIGERVTDLGGGSREPTADAPAVLLAPPHGHREHAAPHALPWELYPRWAMSGGSFITGDSTFTAVTGVPAIQLHDHVEGSHRVGDLTDPGPRP